MQANALFRPPRARFLLLVLALLVSGGAQAQKTVSFLANVQPDSDQTGFNVRINDQSIPTSDLNAMLRPSGGMVLRVTSLHIVLLDALTLPAASDYAVVFLGALSPRGSIDGFGAGTLSTSGGATRQIQFDPGLYVSLREDQVLTLRSQVQSNQVARVEVHGFLETP